MRPSLSSSDYLLAAGVRVWGMHLSIITVQSTVTGLICRHVLWPTYSSLSRGFAGLTASYFFFSIHQQGTLTGI
jgi:hypothetical protein